MQFAVLVIGIPFGAVVIIGIWVLVLIAVDPRVIRLNTKIYVEDYGPAVAGDTGGRILGRHIDLGYPDDQPLPVIFEWRYVYLRTPVPAADRIRYVLPNWPQRN